MSKENIKPHGKTIAIDFDGVIHKYSKGWHDGSCYDVPVDGVFDAIGYLLKKGYSVFILSTRKPKQIKRWMKDNTLLAVEIIPWWKKFWNKPYVIGVTRRKLPAHVYIDDRAINFDGNWLGIVNAIQTFNTYQKEKS